MEIKAGQVWTNIKHGTNYSVVGDARNVTDGIPDNSPRFVVYTNEEGQMFVREKGNFRDKFKINYSPPPLVSINKDRKVMAQIRSEIAKENGFSDFTDLAKSAIDEKEEAAFENEVQRRYEKLTCTTTFDESKHYETVSGFNVKIGFDDNGIIHGWTKLNNTWEPMWWYSENLMICNKDGSDVIYNVFERDPGEFALREKKSTLTISHTIYILNDGRCFVNAADIDSRALFAELTINAEVEERSSRVVSIPPPVTQ